MGNYRNSNWRDILLDYDVRTAKKAIMDIIEYATNEEYDVSAIYHALHTFVDDTMYDYEIKED